MYKIVCLGPGPKFKGGISNYNTSLAKAFSEFIACEIHILSWSQQYPFFIPREFEDKSSKEQTFAHPNIKVHYTLDYNNPFSWRKTGKLIESLAPDLIIVQWAISIQAIPLYFLSKHIRLRTSSKLIFDLHNIGQKENSLFDKNLTALGIKQAHGYILHSKMTEEELLQFLPHKYLKNKKTLALYHPVYDLFKPIRDFPKEEIKKKYGLNKNVFLFFGFIRKYKGLHHVIEAFAKLAKKRDDISLIIAGEAFWDTLDDKSKGVKLKKAIFEITKKIFIRKQDDEAHYRPLEAIKKWGIEDKVLQHIRFIPNEQVAEYFQMSDYLLLFYSYATPSGVESLAYNFELPIIASDLGHFKTSIKVGETGYLVQPGNTDHMAEIMHLALENPIAKEPLVAMAQTLSWKNYVQQIERQFLQQT
jgi:glycosyltransferase involved in cell wall biosynthesis